MGDLQSQAGGLSIQELLQEVREHSPSQHGSKLSSFVRRAIGKKELPENRAAPKVDHEDTSEKESLPFGLTRLYPAEDDAAGCLVDLIAVHGMNGHPEHSWTDKSTGVLWLRDLLPLDFPQLKVWSYGYNSDPRSQSQSLFDWRDQAAQLVYWLRITLTGERPIIFVCASTGGLIVKQAVVLMQNSARSERQLLERIESIIFLGTPHRGTRFINPFNLVTSSSSLSKLRLDALRPNSEVLQRLQHEFVIPASEYTFSILSFYETLPTPPLGLLVPKDSVFIGLPQEKVLGLHATHRDMFKFRSPADSNYRLVGGSILEVLRSISSEGTHEGAAERASDGSERRSQNVGHQLKDLTDSALGRHDQQPWGNSIGDDEASDENSNWGDMAKHTGKTDEELTEWRQPETANFVFDSLGATGTTTGKGFGDQWFSRLTENVYPNIEERITADDKVVKVAVIDTGVEVEHPLLKQFFDRGQIRCESFIDGLQGYNDICGHGTHITHLLLKVAPDVKIFAARVFVSGQASEFHKNRSLIAKAIHKAVHDWDVDIISMSWGYQEEDTDIKNEIRDAFHHGKIIFAAASNAGAYSRHDVSFPANLRQVICINSTDAFGNPSAFNPTPSPDRAFSVIGEGLEAAWPIILGIKETKVCHGSSLSTAIAAGLACLILQYARQVGAKGQTVNRAERLNHCDEMRKMFYSMAKEREKYLCLEPATVFYENGEDRHMKICMKISSILDNL